MESYIWILLLFLGGRHKTYVMGKISQNSGIIFSMISNIPNIFFQIFKISSISKKLNRSKSPLFLGFFGPKFFSESILEFYYITKFGDYLGETFYILVL
mgnify:CR=1 FL=1